MVKNRILLYIIIDNSFCIFTKKKKNKLSNNNKIIHGSLIYDDYLRLFRNAMKYEDLSLWKMKLL